MVDIPGVGNTGTMKQTQLAAGLAYELGKQRGVQEGLQMVSGGELID